MQESATPEAGCSAKHFIFSLRKAGSNISLYSAWLQYLLGSSIPIGSLKLSDSIPARQYQTCARSLAGEPGRHCKASAQKACGSFCVDIIEEINSNPYLDTAYRHEGDTT